MKGLLSSSHSKVFRLFFGLTLTAVGLVSTAPTAAGQTTSSSCSINIYMYDSYGDGWNGNQLLLYQGDSLIDAVDCSGSYSEATVYIQDGYVDLAWTPGSWAEECRFIITNNENDTLYVSSNGMSGYSDFFETIEVSCSGCSRPTHLQLLDRTAYQLTVSWNAVDSSTWLVEYGPYGFDHGGGTLVSTSNNYITLSGLSPYSSYQVYVARICDGDTSQWRSAVFATLCDVEACTYTVRLVDDYYGNFQGGRILICTPDGGVVDIAQPPSDWYNYSYDYSLQGCPGMLLLRYEATNNNIEDYVLQSRYITVLDSEGDTVSHFNCYDAYYASGFYDTIDYSCPTCFAVEEPWNLSIDSTSATVSWYGDAPSYIVLYGPVNSTSGYSSMTTNSTSATLTGLQPMTNYCVQVRAFCGDGDTSRVRTLYFTTLPGIYDRVYVSPNATGTPDGHSWSTALGNLSTALNIAAINRQVYGTNPEVWVAVGTYRADTNNLVYRSSEDSYAFAIFNGVNVYGGFLGNETSLSQRPQFSTSNSQFSILDGEGQYGVLFNSGYNESPTRWDGFVIQHGSSSYGAGCLLGEYNILSNCWIRSNYASSSGGGIYLSGNNSRVENCVIDSNTANWGGGIYSDSYESEGSSVSLISNCMIQNNTSTQSAGGVYVKCEIANCTIQNNNGRFGGGMSVYNSEIAHIHHNVIRNNTAEMSGGGAYSWGGVLDNNLIYGNTAFYGGAIYSDGRTTDYNYDGGTFYNNTLVSNTATYGGGVYNSSDGGTYVNTIIWGNQTGDGPNQYYNSFRNIHHCALEGALTGAEELLNISLAHSNTGTADSNYVAFVSPSTGDYHLADNSACIDGGDNEALADSTDIGGATRRQGWSIDIGAYESSSTSSCPAMESIVAENITYNSATITWTPVSGMGEYMLRYGIQGTGPFDTLYVTDTTTTLSGLAVYSAYTVLVNPICSSNTSPHYSFVTFSTLPSPSEIVYVKPQASGIGDGTSWDNAMNDPNRAIAIADARRQYYGSPATVWIAAGTYYGDIQSNNAFTLLDGVNVYGGFSGNEPSSYDLSLRDFTINTTILHGGSQHRVLYQNYNFDSVTILSGLTITGGFIYSGNGAGALLRGNTHLIDCIVTDNHVSTDWNYTYGAGIYANSSYVERPVTIDRCTISNNGALTGSYLYGGALYMTNTILSNSVVTGNQSYYRTIYSYSGNNVITNCLIYNNNAQYYSGIYNYYATLTINNSDIVSNNSTQSYGPMYTEYNGYVTLNNTVVWGNTTNENRSYFNNYNYYNIHNCAFDGMTESLATVVSLSDSNDGTAENANYPRFTEPTEGDYTLMTGSALIDAGDSNYATTTTDLDGNPRVQFEQVDIGCYENNEVENCPRVIQLTVGPVGYNSAYITFRHSGSEPPSAYQIELKTPYSDWSVYGSTTQEHLFLTSLDTNQQYYLRVRSVCDDTLFGQYSRTVSFHTRNQGNCIPLIVGTTETTDGGWCLPTNTCYYQSYTQQIFTATEMGGEARNIDTIGFQYVYPYTDTRTIDIYLAHTSQSSLSGFLPSTGFELVYSGSFNFNNTGTDYWSNIPLQTTFAYNGTDNLLVAMVDHTGSSIYCDNGLFRTHSTNEATTAYKYGNNSSAYNPASPPSATLYYYRTNTRFGGSCQLENTSCPLPNIVVRNVTSNSAEVEWVANIQYDLQIRNLTTNGEFETLTISNGDTLTGLAQGTTYEIRMRNVCQEMPYVSDWNSVRFTTLASISPIVYVAQQASGSGDGSSWSNATDDINFAQSVAAARASIFGTPATVWVATGIYLGDTVAGNAFVAIEGVNVYGGFAGVEPENYDISQRDFTTNPTVLDGGNGRRVLYQPSMFTNRTTWDGFTIQHGFQPSTGSSTYGHGAYLRGGFTLSHCTVKDNATIYDGVYHYGGGIFVTDAYSDHGVIIDHCDISGNGDDNGNKYTYGSAIYSASNTSIINCRLHDNISRQGALYSSTGIVYVHNTLIDHNYSQYSGAGVYIYNGTTYLENTTVANNSISNNSSYLGGGIYCYNSTYMNLLNTVVWGNHGTSSSETDNISGYNVSYIANSAIEGLSEASVINLASSNFGEDSSLNYPAFVNPEIGDYRLYELSALIDGGTVTNYQVASYTPNAMLAYDLSDMARTHGTSIDIGCYEYHGEDYCLTPANLSVSQVMNNSAYLAYDSRDGEQPMLYEIDIKADSGVWTPFTATQRTRLFLTGLYPLTDYAVRVRAVCDSLGNTSPYAYASFRTTNDQVECESLTITNNQQTTSSGGVLPTNTYYCYSYTQQVYTATELGNTPRQIDTVSFQYYYSYPDTRNINLYLAHTTVNTLNGHQASSDFQLVYSGTYTFSNTGNEYWNPIVLQSPFDYNGTDNLLVVMVDNTGTYNYSGSKFYTHATPDVRAVYNYRDGSPYNILSPPSANTTSYRSNIKLGGTCGGSSSPTCDRPNIGISELNIHSAKVDLLVSSNYELLLRKVGEPNFTTVTIGADSTVYNLEQNTRYQMKVRNICSIGDTSGWRSIFFTTLPSSSPIVYVAQQATGLGDGSSWENAMSDINRAMDHAVARGNIYGTPSQVWVATGIYYGDTAYSNNAFTMRPGVSVYGGFMGNEPESYDLSQRNLSSYPTILSGLNQRRVLYQPSSFEASTAVVWDGFTLQQGQTSENGAGVYLRAYSSLCNCLIKENYSTSGNGGGVYSSGTSFSYYDSLNIYHTIYTPLIEKCQITNNRAYSGGGAYLNYATVDNCLIANNTATNYGGGLYSYSYSVINNSTIVANAATEYGGVYSSHSYPTLANCIVWGNTAPSGSQLTNTNISYSAVDEAVSDTTMIALSSNNVGSFNSPRFVAPSDGIGYQYAGGNWQLADSSFCIGRGSNAYVTTSTDIAGNTRIQQGRVDMGCYESPYNKIQMPTYVDSIVYVTESGSGLMDGTSWQNAMADLQNAVNTASMCHGRVWVAAGTYYGNPNNANAFIPADGVDVYGGFAGNEPVGYDLLQRDLTTHATILDGQNLQRVLCQPVSFNTMTVWDGLTLQNGHLNSGDGAGAYIYGNFQIVNCIVQYNTTLNGNGAGIYKNSSYSNPLYITNTQILDNTAAHSSSFGGGLYAYYTTVTNCRISGNSAGYGAGVRTSTQCYFYNSIIDHNTANVYPGYGAIYLSSGNSYFENCDIVNNTCTYSTTSGTGGVYSYSSYGTFNNCIIWGNKRGYYVNNLLGTPTINSSAIEGGYTGSTNIIDLATSNDGTDPAFYYVRFIDPDNSDYHLHATSSMIDAGDSTLVSQPYDYDGNARIYGGTVDLGAFESSEVSPCPPVVGLQVDSVTSFSAKLSWHPTTGQRYLVEYGIHGNNSHDTTSTTDTSITLTGLTLNRYYSARVRVICDTGSTSLYSIPVNFNTVCDTTLITPLSDFTTFSPADSDIVYQQNVTFSWASIAEADSYDFYIWADDASEPSTPTRTGLVSTTVTYRIPYFDNNRGQIYHWRVVARKECINKSSAVNHIQVAYLPDLHVSGFATSTPVAGNAMTIQWTVVNDGQGSTPPGATWYDYIWLTSEFGIGGNQTAGDETLLASIPNLQSLAPGESYTNSIQINLPNGSEGDYFLFVLADQYQTSNIHLTPTGGSTIPNPYTPSVTGVPYPYLQSSGYYSHSIVETVNTDNFFYKLMTILPQPTPDLQVVTITHPLNAFSGENFTVNWQVNNLGGAATASTMWSDAIYLSAEPTFSYSEATLLGTVTHTGGLAIGESYNQSLSSFIPIQFSGTYYVYVKTDISDVVYESIFEGNNTTMSSQAINIVMSPPADLAVDSILFLHDTVSTLGQYTLQYRISNVGARAVTNQSWRDAVYISTDTTFAPNTAVSIGNRLNNVTLGIGESIVVTQNITIPDAINGFRYLFVRTDINDDIFEYIFEDNNIGMREMPISVCPPDLEVSWLTVPDTINPNQPFLVRWRVQNTGFGNIWSRTITDNVTYNGTTIYTSSQNTSLAAGQYIDKQAWIQIPCVSIHTGQLKVNTDPNAIIYEASESNNVSSGIVPVVVAPDLSVSSLQVADTLWSGTTIPVSWTLTNSGTAPVDAVVTDGFYLADNTIFATTTSLSKYSRHVTLGAGESIEETTVLTLPNGIAGTYYIHQQTNEGSTTTPAICEGANTTLNSAHTSGRTVMLSPYADLRVMQIVTDDTVNIGQSLIVDYTVKNQGTGILENVNVNTTFYLSAATVLNTSYATQIGSDIQRMTLAVDTMETYSAILRVPTSLSSGNYYIYAVTDADDTVYEYTGESNNTTRGERVNVKVYPLDLSITALQGNTSVEWGHTYTYTLTINNNSQVPTLTNYWYDRLYLSSDNVLQDADRQVGSVYHNGQVAGGGSYNVTYTVTIPYGAPSTCYLIAVADDNNANPDINATNNMLVQALNVSSVPTPDLAISDIQIVEPSVVSGQLAHIAYTVTNVGTVDVVAQSWTDKLFLSANSTYESGDVEVGTVTQRNMTLLAGASYTDTMEFRVSLPQHGSFYFIGKANSNNGFFEDNTSNNIGLTMATVSLPLPGDLVVSQVTHEDSIFSGDIIHISWSVNNVGENTLSGNGLRSLAYLSADTVFDVNDRLLGNVNRDNVMLPPGGNLSQSFSCRLSGLREGDYYVIVKTDVTNAFNEVNDTNNNMLSEYPVALTVRNLPFNTPTADTLYNNVSSDFKLVVGDKTGETVRIHLDSEDSLSGAVNMLYVSHNNIGNNLNYTYSTIGQFTHNPELYIPSTEDGYYGINAIGSTPVGSSQAVTLSADILPFELREVSPNVGGNNGMVTVELTGSRFRPDMRVWMRRDSSTVIIPDTVIYDSYYRAFATFDLDGKDTGVYSMGVLNYCEGEAILDNAFTIKEGSAENLSTNLILPQTPRPNRIVVLMLEFGNIGTTDITAPVVELESMGRSYISLTSEGLTDHQTTLRIPLQVENDVPYLIRPGARGSVTIFCYTSGNMAFSVKRVQ